MDYAATGQLLDNILFEETNATANLQSGDLINLAQILDSTLPLGATDPGPYIAAITNALTGNLATLSQDQIVAASAWFLPYREPPPPELDPEVTQ